MSRTTGVKVSYEDLLKFCWKYNSVKQFINIFCSEDEEPTISFKFPPDLANQKLVFEKELERMKKEKLTTPSAKKPTNNEARYSKPSPEKPESSSNLGQKPIKKMLEREFSSSDEEIEKEPKNVRKPINLEEKKKSDQKIKKNNSSSSKEEIEKEPKNYSKPINLEEKKNSDQKIKKDNSSSSEEEIEKEPKNVRKPINLEEKKKSDHKIKKNNSSSSEEEIKKDAKKRRNPKIVRLSSSSSSHGSNKGRDMKEKRTQIAKNLEENQKKSLSSEDFEKLMDVYEESDSENEDKMIETKSILNASIISNAFSHQRSTIIFGGLNEEIMFVLKKHVKIREKIENILKSYGFDYEILDNKINLLYDSSNKNKIELVKTKLSPILNIKSLTFDIFNLRYHGLKKVFLSKKIEKFWLEVFDYRKNEKRQDFVIKLFYFEKTEDPVQSTLLEGIKKLFKDYECKKINFINFHRRSKFREDKEFMALLNKESSMIQEVFEEKLKDNLETEIEKEKWNKNKYVKLLVFKNKENQLYDSSLIYYWIGSNFQKDFKPYFREVDKLFRERMFIRMYYVSENLEKYLKMIDKEVLYDNYKISLDFNENEIFFLGLRDSFMKFLLELDQIYPKINKHLIKANTLKITINKNKFCLDRQSNEEYQPKIVNFFKENKIDSEIFRSQLGNVNTLYTEIKYQENVSNKEKLKILFSMMDHSKEWSPALRMEDRFVCSNSKKSEKKTVNEEFCFGNEDDDEINF